MILWLVAVAAAIVSVLVTVYMLSRRHRPIQSRRSVGCDANAPSNTCLKRPVVSTRDTFAKPKWYHGHISNDEADRRLRKGANNVNGAYLVYVVDPVQRDLYQYKLLVYYKGQLHHQKIWKHNSDGMYVLGKDGDEYNSVEELVKAHEGDRGKPIRLDKDQVVTLSRSYVGRTHCGSHESDHKHKLWYHGKISNKCAKNRMNCSQAKNAVDGAYLVYDRPNVPDQYILMVSYQAKCLRWQIIKSSSDGMYVLAEDRPGVPRYPTVRELIKAHRGVRGTPIRIDENHVVTLSKSYICYPL